MALLDDDDEWLEEKLATQLAVARSSRYMHPDRLMSLYRAYRHGDVVAATPGSRIGKAVSELLILPEGLFGGEGLAVLTATRSVVVSRFGLTNHTIAAARGLVCLGVADVRGIGKGPRIAKQ